MKSRIGAHCTQLSDSWTKAEEYFPFKPRLIGKSAPQALPSQAHKSAIAFLEMSTRCSSTSRATAQFPRSAKQATVTRPTYPARSPKFVSYCYTLLLSYILQEQERSFVKKLAFSPTFASGMERSAYQIISRDLRVFFSFFLPSARSTTSRNPAIWMGFEI